MPKAACTAKIKAFAENFYQEYGIVITMEGFLPIEEPLLYAQGFEQPVTVLDFSGCQKLAFRRISEGSVWLDMDASDEKEKRIRFRNEKITYFSLKTVWKMGV